jgi:hypothetical protein
VELHAFMRRPLCQLCDACPIFLAAGPVTATIGISQAATGRPNFVRSFICKRHIFARSSDDMATFGRPALRLASLQANDEAHQGRRSRHSTRRSPSCRRRQRSKTQLRLQLRDAPRAMLGVPCNSPAPNRPTTLDVHIAAAPKLALVSSKWDGALLEQ